MKDIVYFFDNTIFKKITTDGPFDLYFFSPDSTTLLTTIDNDNKIILYKHTVDDDWQLSRILEGHTQPIIYATFSRDGSKIITTSEDQTVRIWSQTSDGLWKSQVLGGYHNRVDFAAKINKDNSLIATRSGSLVLVWKLHENKWESTQLGTDTMNINFINMKTDGTKIVTLSEDSNIVRLWTERYEKYMAITRA